MVEVIEGVSHLDHSVPASVQAWALEQVSDRVGFFLVTLDIPADLPSAVCGLYGPSMGDNPVEDHETWMQVRGDRAGPSRMVARPLRPCRQVTVIGGSYQGRPTILYTIFGGPAAPREPFEPSLEGATLEESRAFWSAHALASEQ